METYPRRMISMETGIMREENSLYSPPAKKMKLIHEDHNEKTSIRRKEWESVLGLLHLTPGNDSFSLSTVTLNKGVGIKAIRANDRSKLINVGTDEDPDWHDCRLIQNVVNHNDNFYTIEYSKMGRLKDVMAFPCMQVFNLHELMENDLRLQKICLDEQNHFIHSRYKAYRFNKDDAGSDKELHEKANDFEYLINLCRHQLETLNIEEYPFSRIIPSINFHCNNLTELILQFKNINSQDFENAFSNMSHIKILRINWQCKDESLPLTLVKSLEQLAGTLEELCFSRNENQNYLCLPDLSIFVFPKLITLKKLTIINFEPGHELFQAISEIKNLTYLRFTCSWMNNHPVFDTIIDMYPIGNLENLQTLYIDYDCGVTDEFLINLSNNATKLRHLDIIGKNITDNGMIALNNLKQLESLKLNLTGLEKNEFITDRSIQCLVFDKLEYLQLSNCTWITNRSVHELFKNLRNLNNLHVRNTKVTCELIKDMLQITEYYNKPIFVYVSFEDCYDIFKLLRLSGVYFKTNFNARKYIDILF